MGCYGNWMFIVDGATFRSIRPSSGLEYNTVLASMIDIFKMVKRVGCELGQGWLGVSSGFSSLYL